MNPFRDPLGIAAPDLARLLDHPEAIPYSLLIATLLERGRPMTLDEVAVRLEQAGFGERAAIRTSLSRCRPGRPPVVREGDLYGLDPLHDELSLWAFRLGLLPPKPLRPPRPSGDLRLVAEDPPAHGSDTLRDRLHSLDPYGVHLILERAVDHLTPIELEQLVVGLVRVDGPRAEEPLVDRLERHWRATRSCMFRDELVLGAPHGRREPLLTTIWLARTTHLIELAIDALPFHDELAMPLDRLLDAVREVDDEPDRYVVFEDDDSAILLLGSTITDAERALRDAERDR